jgi:hypothetical protein
MIAETSDMCRQIRNYDNEALATCLVVSVCGLSILFVPVPSILRESAQCQPCAPGLLPLQCPKCPHKGDVEWRPSLAKMFWSRLFEYHLGERVQTVTPANWKTYTSSLGYSFSYPQNMPIEVYGNSTVVRIDPSDPRLIVGLCPRWISFSSADSSSSAKKIQDEYGCIYNAFVSKEKVFIKSQYREGSQKIIDQILSTFRFTN